MGTGLSPGMILFYFKIMWYYIIWNTYTDTANHSIFKILYVSHKYNSDRDSVCAENLTFQIKIKSTCALKMRYLKHGSAIHIYVYINLKIHCAKSLKKKL
jgi:hypothetical protein